MQPTRITARLRLLLLGASLALSSNAAELARWQVSSSSADAGQIRLERLPDSPWHVEKVGTREVALLNFSGRPARVTLADGKSLEIPSYDLVLE